MERRDVTLVIPKVQMQWTYWVDHNGPLQPHDTVLMTDAVVHTWTALRGFDDAVTVSDSISFFKPFLFFDEAVAMTDGGTVTRFDYVDPSYLATPANYVGEQRVF
jgi:hypothetical protein